MAIFQTEQTKALIEVILERAIDGSQRIDMSLPNPDVPLFTPPPPKRQFYDCRERRDRVREARESARLFLRTHKIQL